MLMIRTCRKMLLRILALLYLLLVQAAFCSAQTSSDVARMDQLLQDAQSSFDKQEFSASFDLYQRVLALDPDNQIARKNIFEMAAIYKHLEEVARKYGEREKAQIFQQRQKDITRYLLKMFTLQLEISIKNYRTHKAVNETGEDMEEQIVLVLEKIIKALNDLKGLYKKEMTGDEERAKHMIERIDKSLQVYERELTQYTNRLTTESEPE